MNDYMRNIFYLRKVEQGISIPGAGHIRLERKREYLHLLLRVTEGYIPEGTPVYGLYKKDEAWHRLKLGTLSQLAGEWETKLRLTSLPDRAVCEEIAGIFIGEKQIYWAGENPGLQLPYEELDEPEKRTMREPAEKPEKEPVKISEETAGEQAGETLSNPASKPADDPVPDTAVKPEPAVCPPAELEAAEMYPFEDDEMSWCRQIGPEDFSSLPMACWRMGNNSFVLQGYYNYRHLLYAGDGSRYYVGVPGQYHRKEQYLARQFGFPRFKGTKRKRTTMGDFGYWLQEIGGNGDDRG